MGERLLSIRNLSRVPQRQLTFPDRLGRIEEGLAHILRGEVRMLSDDLANSHPSATMATTEESGEPITGSQCSLTAPDSPRNVSVQTTAKGFYTEY